MMYAPVSINCWRACRMCEKPTGVPGSTITSVSAVMDQSLLINPSRCNMGNSPITYVVVTRSLGSLSHCPSRSTFCQLARFTTAERVWVASCLPKAIICSSRSSSAICSNSGHISHAAHKALPGPVPASRNVRGCHAGRLFRTSLSAA